MPTCPEAGNERENVDRASLRQKFAKRLADGSQVVDPVPCSRKIVAGVSGVKKLRLDNKLAHAGGLAQLSNNKEVVEKTGDTVSGNEKENEHRPLFRQKLAMRLANGSNDVDVVPCLVSKHSVSFILCS